MNARSFIYHKNCPISMKKKGQVTIFIVIGVIILIASVSYFAVNELFLKDQFQAAIEKTRNVPQQVLPITNYLSSCTKDLAIQGTNLLGIQGGYINLPTSNLPTSPFNPLNSFLEIIPNSNLKTAVWFREQSNGIQTTTAPTKASMEQELDDYIDLNFQSCINGLTQFSDQDFLFIISNKPKTKVTILEDKINVEVAFPIQILKEGISFNLESHYTQLNSPLGEMHTMAIEILNKENENFFMEEKTIDTLVAYDSEVPFSGTTTSCSPRIWSKTGVIQSLKNILMENVAAFKIKGTNYVLQNEKYNYLVFDALKNNHKSITVNFMYSPSFPTSVDISPSEGDNLKEDSINQKALPGGLAIASAFFCLSQHRFVYTIKYPVLITLTSADGSIFQFATQVIIERNEARRNREEAIDFPNLEDKICKYPQKSLLVETYTTNPQGDLIPLTGADLFFKCSPVSCLLELKQIKNNQYLVKTPACVNGILEAKKEGYVNGKSLAVSTNEEVNNVISIILPPLYKKQLKVFIIDKTTGESRLPYSSEQLFFQLTNKDTSVPYSTSINYPSEDNTIQLMPGEYSISSYVMGNSTWPITTPKQLTQHCYNVGGSLFGIFGNGEEKCTTLEIPETKMYNAIKGGANFDFNFDQQSLASNSELVIYTMASPIPGDMEGMAKIFREIDSNKDDPRFKYPEL